MLVCFLVHNISITVAYHRRKRTHSHESERVTARTHERKVVFVLSVINVYRIRWPP